MLDYISVYSISFLLADYVNVYSGKMSFFDKIKNSMIVNSFKQLYNRRHCKICPTSWHIPRIQA